MAAPTLRQIAACRVLVVGDAMLDRYWFGAVDRISPEAPVPVVRVVREEERLGGAANVALNVRRLGAASTLLTMVGNDEPGARLLRMLQDDGVRAPLGPDDRLRTIVKLRVIGRSQQLVRVDFEPEPHPELQASVRIRFEQMLGACDVVLFSDYGKGSLDTVAQMIAVARRASLPVLVDPKGSDYSRYAGATVITPNRAELAQVVGSWSSEAELERKAQRLRAELELDGLLLTRSEEGMSLFDTQAGDGGHLHVQAQAREVFDVTGAGDTVIATLAVMLGCRLGLRDAVPWANKAGGIVVGKFGTASVAYEELFA